MVAASLPLDDLTTMLWQPLSCFLQLDSSSLLDQPIILPPGFFLIRLIRTHLVGDNCRDGVAVDTPVPPELVTE